MGAIRILKGCLFWGAAAVTGVVVGAVLYFPGRYYLGKHRFTPPIEGRVTDAVTGEPVPKLLVTADWTFRQPISSYGRGERENALTDAEGRFSFRAHDVSKLWSSYDGMDLQLRHPLYDFKMLVVDAGNGSDEPGVKQLVDKIVVETTVMKLEDRYVNLEDGPKLGYALAGIKPLLFEQVKKQFGVTYDIDSTLLEIQEIVQRFPSSDTVPGSHILPREYNALLLRFGRTPQQ